MEIGSKIKNARLKIELTQEQVAELLGVSRQTISNWENEKSYPDIVSVVKMSDIYSVSLDFLLKGEERMDNYINYLDESTNVVKSKEKSAKLKIILSYLLIWAVGIIFFWCCVPSGDEMAYSIVFIWLVLPIATFVESVIIGVGNYWEKKKWLSVIFFGLMFMAATYCTFSMANTISFGNLNAPDFFMLFIGAGVSLSGTLIGHLIFLLKSKRT